MSDAMIESNEEIDRREVFRQLVTYQDAGESVEDSRHRVAMQFEISFAELLGIEQEGRRGNWPPL